MTKKIILICTFIGTYSAGNAQTKYGIYAGVNLSDIKYENTGSSTKTSSKSGVILGAFSEISLGKSMSFRPEINFIQKGAKANTYYPGSYSINSVADLEQDFTLNYVQIIPDFIYNLRFKRHSVFIGAGPEIAFGIFGKYKEKVTIPSNGGIIGSVTVRKETALAFDGGKNEGDNIFHLKNLDFGANFTGGISFAKGISFSTGYSMGLRNIASYDGYEFKNRGFFIKVGYRFSEKDLKEPE